MSPTIRHTTLLIRSWLLLSLGSACTHAPSTLFTKLDPSVSGIHFNNAITENDSVNLIADEYAYMGSGVGVGDFNKDGLPDLFFGGNQTTCRLYLNLGDHHFRDITKTAGLETSSWCTGISVVDINNDGYPDIYVCVSGNTPGHHNLLYINNHDLTFTERAAEYGLADTGYCTQAVFFDYDGDGLLDMYLVRHELHPAVSQNDIVKPDTTGLSIRSDKLYRNMGMQPNAAQPTAALPTPASPSAPHPTPGDAPSKDTRPASPHPLFKDVSLAAGIRDDGYGLGVVVSDFNGDGWPDVYVTNDYLSNDLLWINNRNGTFTNVIAGSLGHQSYSSMGVDAADINNDGLPDIATLDMQPEDNYRKKTMYSFMSYERYELERRAGFQPEFMRNMLHLNRGTLAATPRSAAPLAPNHTGPTPTATPRSAARPAALAAPPSHTGPTPATHRPTRQADAACPAPGDPAVLHPPHAPATPYFSEIGQLAGISETDWSWSILLADFDNDGYKDIAITNGEGRDLINADFIKYRAETYGRMEKQTRDQLLRKQLDSMGKITLRNYYFHNNGDCTFSNESKLSGIDESSIANGAAYVDLDNDGDLDLVINNIDQKASIYINNTRDDANYNTRNAGAHDAPIPAAHYLNFILQGDSLNRSAFGTKIQLYQAGQVQTVEQYPVRGYASSVDTRLHFGLGSAGRVDSVIILWPRGRNQHLQHVAIDTTLTLDIANATTDKPALPQRPASLQNISDSLHVSFRHHETFFNDFAFNSLLPQKYSQLGPFISTGDLNGDGLPDFFIGGAYNQSGDVWLQQKDGSFIGKPLVNGVKHEEDMQSVLVDVDGDHDLDLIVVSGSTEFPKGSPYLTPRLYLNDGKGNFTLKPGSFPQSVNTVAQTISATTGSNGQLQIFIGGRVSQDYPLPPKSYLLEYRDGSFYDITQDVCPELADAGMITASAWADIDGDGQNELILAGDWMPIRIFKTDHGRLKELIDSAGLSDNRGMWKSLAVVDVDGDGDLDIIAGNGGTNNPYHVSAEKPMRLIAKDFQGNGKTTPILCYYIPDETGKKTLQLGMDLDHLVHQEPSFKDRFPTNAEFAKADLTRILPEELVKDAIVLNCNELHTCWFENLGNGKFRKHILPVEAQFAPVNAILTRDFDGDGKLDLVLAGNEYQAEVVAGRYDASYGLLLHGLGHGNFQAMPHLDNGIFIKGDVKDIKCIKNSKGHDLILVGINDAPMQVFTPDLPSATQRPLGQTKTLR